MPKRQRTITITTEQSIRLLEKLADRVSSRKKEVAVLQEQRVHWFGLCLWGCDCKVLAYEYHVLCQIETRLAMVYESIKMFPSFESVRFARGFLWSIMQLKMRSPKHTRVQYRGRCQAYDQLINGQTFTRAHLQSLRDGLDFLQGRLPRRKEVAAIKWSPTF